MVHKLRLLAVLFLLAVSSVGAQGDPNLDSRAREIEGLLIAPCCWRQPVSAHFSPASDEVKAEVRRLLNVGLSKDEVLEKFVAQYGERILAKPKASGFNLLAYFLPIVFLALGAAVAVLIVKKLRPRAEAAAVGQPSAKMDSKISERLEKELWG